MSVLNLTATTDATGSVRLETGIPNSRVRATIVVEDETVKPSDEARKKQWEEFVRRTAGSIEDPTFRRHPQGEFPKRESLR